MGSISLKSPIVIDLGRSFCSWFDHLNLTACINFLAGLGANRFITLATFHPAIRFPYVRPSMRDISTTRLSVLDLCGVAGQLYKKLVERLALSVRKRCETIDIGKVLLAAFHFGTVMYLPR